MSTFKEELIEAQKRLDDQQNFEDNYLTFINSSELIDAILKIISFKEKEYYVLGKMNISSPDHHEFIRLTDVSNNDEKIMYHDNVLSGENKIVSLIMRVKSYKQYMNYVFPSVSELTQFLSERLVDEKYMVINPNIEPEDFKLFPYIEQFLETLILWRRQNKVLEIPTDILTDKTNDFLMSLVKQKEDFRPLTASEYIQIHNIKK